MILTEEQVDSLKELINIGVGRGASVLNTMLSSHIRLQVPFVKVLSVTDWKREMEEFREDRMASVLLRFKGKCSGTAHLAFPTDSASALLTTLVEEGQTDPDIDSIRSGTLCEVGNVVLNGVMGSIANLLELRFEFSVPVYVEESSERLFGIDINDANTVIVLARTRFVVEELDVEGDIVLVLEVDALHKLLEAIDTMGADNR